MTELEERLTHEYSKLAAQYAQEQTRLSAQVEGLGTQVANLAEQVRQLAAQYARDQEMHIEWARLLTEHTKHVGKLTDNYQTLTKDLTELLP